MEQSLNDLMEFDHIVLVKPNGTVTDDHSESAYFETSMYLGDDDEWHDDFQLPKGWTLLTGFTGQYGYNGPVMHPSEFIGGNLEKHILETPGYWVALVVESYGKHEWQLSTFTGTKTCAHCGLLPVDEDDYESLCQQEPAGWVLAHKELED